MKIVVQTKEQKDKTENIQLIKHRINMKKEILLSILLAFTVGIEAQAIDIGSAADLALIGTVSTHPLDGDYIQTADIDLSGYANWAPIGDDTSPFTGTFDGKDFTISNLQITVPGGAEYSGLFGYVYQGELSNIHITSLLVGVNGNWYVGGVCGYNEGGTITNCSNNAKITGTGTAATLNMAIGGVCGLNDGGKIVNCSNTAEVNLIGGTINSIGGVCGYNYNGSIEYCSNAAIVRTDNGITTHIGGVCGSNDHGSIKACYNIGGYIYGMDDIGGVCGYNEGGTITACYNTRNVLSTGHYAGGVCGYNMGGGAITACYNTGNVSGNSDVGGVCGDNYGSSITACYNTGVVTGTIIGGVCGSNFGSGTITDCYYPFSESDPTSLLKFGGNGGADPAEWPVDANGWSTGDSIATGGYWASLGSLGGAVYPILYYQLYLTSGSATRIDATNATVNFLAKANGSLAGAEYFYAVVNRGDPAPTIDTTPGSGTPITPASEETINLTSSDLTSPGIKDIYIVVRNAANQLSYDKFHITISGIPTSNLLAFTPTSTPYTGTPRSVSVSPAPGIIGLDGAIIVKYDGSLTPPTVPGTYAITVDIAQSTLYNAINDLYIGNFIILEPIQTPPTPQPIRRQIYLPAAEGFTYNIRTGFHYF
jgi:hypothetical protein